MMTHIRISLKLFLAVCLISGALFFLYCAPTAFADDKSDHHDKKRNKDIGAVFDHVKNEENNEATGQAAAWLLIAANLNVVLSLIIRGTTRYAALPAQINDKIKRLNQLQKKFLLPVHYFLNPLALGVAFIHFMSATSACRASGLPEWGLVLMALITGIGVMVKFKLSPKSLRKNTYQIHTNPIPIALLLVILLIGHAVVD